MVKVFESKIETNPMEFATERVKESRLPEVDFKNLDFGKIISDHMLYCEYKEGQWFKPRLMPYGNLSLSPTALGLHYGQTVFEGMKAYKLEDGNISLFRVDKHYRRFNRSLERMCMPPIPADYFIEGLKAFVNIDSGWVPTEPEAAFYIRPFAFASEERFGVKVSDEYKFIIFAGPVGPYYSKPLRVKLEDRYRRSAPGGTGYAKCGGNYGGAFYPTSLARKEGFDQVIWTDGSPELYIEESGTMNLMFVIDNKVVTPPVSETILDGITRDSFLTLALELGYEIEQRPISGADLMRYMEEGRLQEAFGTGTAAVVAPIKSISVRGNEFTLPDYGADTFQQKAKKMLTEIRTGKIPDKYGWNTVLVVNK